MRSPTKTLNELHIGQGLNHRQNFVKQKWFGTPNRGVAGIASRLRKWQPRPPLRDSRDVIFDKIRCYGLGRGPPKMR